MSTRWQDDQPRDIPSWLVSRERADAPDPMAVAVAYKRRIESELHAARVERVRWREERAALVERVEELEALLERPDRREDSATKQVLFVVGGAIVATCAIVGAPHVWSALFGGG